MSTATSVSVAEYLATTYWPDRESPDDHVCERNVGEFDHSSLQGALITWLRNHQKEWNIHALRGRALRGQRLGVAHDRYRIPDVCVISAISP